MSDEPKPLNERYPQTPRQKEDPMNRLNKEVFSQERSVLQRNRSNFASLSFRTSTFENAVPKRTGVYVPEGGDEFRVSNPPSPPVSFTPSSEASAYFLPKSFTANEAAFDRRVGNYSQAKIVSPGGAKAPSLISNPARYRFDGVNDSLTLSLTGNSDFYKNNVTYGFLLSDYLFQSATNSIFTFVWGGTTLSLLKAQDATALSFNLTEGPTQTVPLPTVKPLGVILGFEGGTAKIYLNSVSAVMSHTVDSSTVQLTTSSLMAVALGSGALSGDLNEIIILDEGPTTAVPKFNAHWIQAYNLQVS